MENQNKYQNAKIYKITDIAYTKCYIGSTCEELSMRMARHRAGYKHFLISGKRYIRAYDLLNEYGIENCKIELVEYFKCDSLAELRKREGEVIKNTDCVNKCVAGRTGKEWREDNKDKMKEYHKEYYVSNIDKITEKSKEYREQNKDKIKEYREQNKDKLNEHMKEYREQNKNKLKEKAKEYHEANKDKINERKREYREKHRDKLNERRRELYKL